MALSPCLSFASVSGISAVHEQCVTDHITCAGAAEPQHGRGNLLWLGNATDWFILQKLGQDLGITAGRDSAIGVLIVPGQTALMRIFLVAYSMAAVFVRPITPCLAA